MAPVCVASRHVVVSRLHPRGLFCRLGHRLHLALWDGKRVAFWVRSHRLNASSPRSRPPRYWPQARRLWEVPHHLARHRHWNLLQSRPARLCLRFQKRQHQPHNGPLYRQRRQWQRRRQHPQPPLPLICRRLPMGLLVVEELRHLCWTDLLGRFSCAHLKVVVDKLGEYRARHLGRSRLACCRQEDFTSPLARRSPGLSHQLLSAVGDRLYVGPSCPVSDREDPPYSALLA